MNFYVDLARSHEHFREKAEASMSDLVRTETNHQRRIFQNSALSRSAFTIFTLFNLMIHLLSLFNISFKKAHSGRQQGLVRGRFPHLTLSIFIELLLVCSTSGHVPGTRAIVCVCVCVRVLGRPSEQFTAAFMSCEIDPCCEAGTVRGKIKASLHVTGQASEPLCVDF